MVHLECFLFKETCPVPPPGVVLQSAPRELLTLYCTISNHPAFIDCKLVEGRGFSPLCVTCLARKLHLIIVTWLLSEGVNERDGERWQKRGPDSLLSNVCFSAWLFMIFFSH